MVVDVGSGPAFVLIPGIQGRWEWMKPTVDALARRWRVLSGSLPSGEFEDYLDYVDNLLESAQVRSAIVCGVSFGGLIALRYAATRGARVRALILVSAPGPRWHLSGYQAKYLRWPVILAPLFMIGALRRTWRELSVTLPEFGSRLSFCGRWAFRVATAPVAPWQ